MACSFRRLLRLCLPTRTVRLAYVILIVVLVFGTFLISFHEISRLEMRSRGRTKMVQFESTKTKQLVFPQSRRSPVNVNSAGRKENIVKSIAWFNPPRWLKQKSTKNMFSLCRHGMKCKISYEEDDIQTADAVVFHGNHISNFTPPARGNNQIYVYFIMEPPAYVDVSPDWRYVFNWTISYRRDSDIWRPYGELRPNNTKLSQKYFQNVLKKKKKAVAWFVSRCESASKREEYVKRLRKYVPVDIYGRCGPYKCGKNCYRELEAYRYFLAFENSLCTDYVTEKFFNTFKYDVIPVVRGGANYPSLYGDGILINTADFHSIKDLGKYLNDLMKNDEEYVRILRKKHKHYVAFPVPWCDLCEWLHNVERHPKTYDIDAWLDEGKCRGPNDLH